MIKDELIRIMETSHEYYYSLATRHSANQVKKWLESFFFLKDQDGKVELVKLEDNILTIRVSIDSFLITWKIEEKDMFSYSIRKEEINLGRMP